MPTPKSKGTVLLQSSNHDSESGSLRDDVDDSTRVTLKNLIIANGTGVSQDESTESGGSGSDIIVVFAGADFLIGGYSELRPISEIITIPPERLKISPAFTNTIDGASTLYGGMDDFLNGNDQTLIIEPPTDQLFSAEVSSVEATLLLPAVQSAREAGRRLSGSSSSNGAWALGSTFELSSGVPFFSQTGTSAGIYMPVGAEHVDTWGNS